MKRIFTLITATLLLAFTAMAKPAKQKHDRRYYANGSSLELKLIPHETYTVIMNGQRFYNVNHWFTVGGLTAGTHNIRVIEHRGRRHSRIVYDGYIHIPYRSRVKAQMAPHRGIQVTHIHRIHHNKPRQNRPGYRQENRPTNRGQYNGHRRNNSSRGY